jgi:phage-related holin
MSQIWLQESKKVLESCFILAISRNQVFFFPLLCYSHNSNNSYIDVVARFGYRTGRTVILFLFVILLIFGDLQQQALYFWQMLFSKISTKDALQGLQHQIIFFNILAKICTVKKRLLGTHSLNMATCIFFSSKYGNLPTFFPGRTPFLHFTLDFVLSP